MGDFQTGLLLFLVGFPTVFLILYLIILLGKGLILLINRYFPEKEVIADALSGEIPSSKMAAIVGAVHVVTKGRGKVTHIEKL